MEPEVCTGESGFGALHQSDDFICSRRRNQAIIDVGISFDELLGVSLLAVLYRFPQSVSCHSSTWPVPKQMDGHLDFCDWLRRVVLLKPQEVQDAMLW